MRHLQKFPSCLVMVLFLIIMMASTSAFAVEQVRIGGTGGALGAIKKLAGEFQRRHPGIVITVLPSLGSAGGIKAVLAEAIDVGISSRPISDKEHGAVSRELGRTAFVFAVPKNNPARGFTLKEIENIYSGVTRTWPDGRHIRAVLRPVTEYDTMLLKSMSPGMDRVVTEALSREGMIIAITDQDNAEALERVPGVFGTITLAQIFCEALPLKALSLDGVKPGPDTLSRGKYPYSKTYYLITKPEVRQPVRRFLDFVYSAQGREILSRCGYHIAR
jgi:phosphate transport system substrate-binding protein